jgi:ribosomal small subunit protein bTHX
LLGFRAVFQFYYVCYPTEPKTAKNMGKGDKKSKKGKIAQGSFGVRRKKNKTKAYVAPAEKPAAKKAAPKKAKEAESAEAPKAKKAAAKKPAAKKTATKKPAAKKKAE